MKKILHIRPAKGLTIPDPATGRHLPAQGDTVEDSSYWRRRLREGSVLKTGNAASKAEDATAPAAEKAATNQAAAAKKGAR